MDEETAASESHIAAMDGSRRHTFRRARSRHYAELVRLLPLSEREEVACPYGNLVRRLAVDELVLTVDGALCANSIRSHCAIFFSVSLSQAAC